MPRQKGVVLALAKPFALALAKPLPPAPALVIVSMFVLAKLIAVKTGVIAVGIFELILIFALIPFFALIPPFKLMPFFGDFADFADFIDLEGEASTTRLKKETTRKAIILDVFIVDCCLNKKIRKEKQEEMKSQSDPIIHTSISK
jgi:hypothetical protein